MPRSKKKTRRLWSAADIKTWKALAGRKKLTVIAREIKRTASAVRRKATDNGISLAMR